MIVGILVVTKVVSFFRSENHLLVLRFRSVASKIKV